MIQPDHLLHIKINTNKHLSNHQEGWNFKIKASVTFCDVPGNATEKDLARVQRILVVPWRQLTTPGERGLVHSWNVQTKKV